MPKSRSLVRLGVVAVAALLLESAGRAQVVPNPNRHVHPSIADIVPGVTFLHGTSATFQYPDGVWNHGEGFAAGPNDADVGGWHGVDDGLHVTSADVHTTHDWAPWTWESEVHPAAPHQMMRFVGHLRPAGLARPNVHPLYGDLTQASSGGPFGDHTYVDQGAFEMFRPLADPKDGQKIVIVIQCWSTVSLFPADFEDTSLTWFKVYQGFFSPDGLARREQAGDARLPDTLFNNTADADVVRHDHNLIATWASGDGYWPIVAYPVLSTVGRPTTLNEQRYLQLVQAIKCILQENSPRNPLQETPLSDEEIDERVVVFFTGGSNGGLAGMWATLRHPHLIDGFYAEVIPPAYQRLYGEQSMADAINHLSGSQVLDAVGEGDFLTWNQFAWSRGHEVYDLSYLRHFLAGRTYRPGCFLIGDEDITTNGAEWIRVLSGTTWAASGLAQSPSPWPSLPNTLAWGAAERRGHTNLIAPIVDPYGSGVNPWHGRDVVHQTIQQAIAQKAAQPSAPLIPAVLHDPHGGDLVLRGLDDVHEWALGRLGEPAEVIPGGSPLGRDDAFFTASQPGAAGTRLGFRESMKIHGNKVYVGSAEGFVSAFEVDTTHVKRPLKKVAESPPLGHGAYAMAIVGSGAQPSLFVGTRRHLHRLGLATAGSSQLPVQASVWLPWEVARPHSLQVADVLTSNPGDELVFASKHGGLVFYSTALTPVYEWPEPGIADFLVQGSGAGATVTILSHRGLLATVSFDANNHATLVAASQPLPRRLTQHVTTPDPLLDAPTQGAALDLELMSLNFGPFGVSPCFISAWIGDEDGDPGLALRAFSPTTLDRMLGKEDVNPFGGRGGFDLATCRESGSSPVGDHLLLLRHDQLLLFDQVGTEVGRKNLRRHAGSPSGLHYPFGEQAHSIVVGELGVSSGGSYSEEVVIATQSGSLVWMHVDDIAAPGEYLPAVANSDGTWQSGYWVDAGGDFPSSPLPATDVQPRTNGSLSATWGITMKPGDDDHLHVLDQRGGYWRVDAGGNVALWRRGLVGGSKGWGWLGAVSPPASAGLVPSHLLVVPNGEQNYVTGVATFPWMPIRVNEVIFEGQPKHVINNWDRPLQLRWVFDGFFVHPVAGSLISGVGSSPSEAWSWSGGNLAEGLRVQQSGALDGLWASTSWPQSMVGQLGDLVDNRDLRHPWSTHAAEQQALAAVKMDSGETVVVLGCPGGRVRVLRPGAWRDNNTPATHHVLGPMDSGADHGYGGCALAVRHEGSGGDEQLRIFFGTLYDPVKRPQLYAGSTGAEQLGFDEVACGGIHEYTWSPTQGLSGPFRSVRLEPTSLEPRGGYCVVGLKIADLLPADGDELIAGTLAGDLFILPAEPGQPLAPVWRTHVPGAIGYYNSMVVADLDKENGPELYVAGSYGLRRFVQQ